MKLLRPSVSVIQSGVEKTLTKSHALSVCSAVCISYITLEWFLLSFSEKITSRIILGVFTEEQNWVAIKKNNEKSENHLTLSFHELVNVAVPWPRFRLRLIHHVKEEVAHQVVFGIACHIDGLWRMSEGTWRRKFMSLDCSHPSGSVASWPSGHWYAL